jgi:hypothetical protein
VVHEPGSDTYERCVELMRAAGSTLAGRARSIVAVEVREARAVVSPVYDDGTVSEDEVIEMYRGRFAR